MMTDEIATATSAFSHFSSKMKRWNEHFYPLMVQDAEEAAGHAIAELGPIFESHVWPDAVRSVERLNSPSAGLPSDYDPENDVIEEANLQSSTCVLLVQSNTGFKDKFRYTLKKRGGEWKLFRRDLFLDDTGKWRSHHI
ncbi:NTF2 fold immunity protein [Allosphingosinicella deserti]|nr:NTF2 fold immunity protein [Sphingomonas deserti]